MSYMTNFSSPEEIKKGHQHLLFLSFPDDDYIKSRNDFLVGKAENLATMKMNILHVSRFRPKSSWSQYSGGTVADFFESNDASECDAEFGEIEPR